MLLGEDTTDEVAKEAAAIELFGASQQDILALKGVRHDDPRETKGRDKGLHNSALVSRRQRCQPAKYALGAHHVAHQLRDVAEELAGGSLVVRNSGERLRQRRPVSRIRGNEDRRDDKRPWQR